MLQVRKIRRACRAICQGFLSSSSSSFGHYHQEAALLRGILSQDLMSLLCLSILPSSELQLQVC